MGETKNAGYIKLGNEPSIGYNSICTQFTTKCGMSSDKSHFVHKRLGKENVYCIERHIII